MLTKLAFLAAYKAALPAAYPWAADAAKLDRFMESVAATIGATPSQGGVYSATWNHDSDVAKAIWIKAGNKASTYTRARLRALPLGD